MIFKYVDRTFTGTRAEILRQIETSFSIYFETNGWAYYVDEQDIHLGEESFSIDKINRSS